MEHVDAAAKVSLQRQRGRSWITIGTLDAESRFEALVGGEIRDYTQMLAQSREQSIDRMCDEARRLGANAVVAARFTTSMVSNAAAEILVIGTAVTIEDA